MSSSNSESVVEAEQKVQEKQEEREEGKKEDINKLESKTKKNPNPDINLITAKQMAEREQSNDNTINS
jgi:hypothetical protein